MLVSYSGSVPSDPNGENLIESACCKPGAIFLSRACLTSVLFSSPLWACCGLNTRQDISKKTFQRCQGTMWAYVTQKSRKYKCRDTEKAVTAASKLTRDRFIRD